MPVYFRARACPDLDNCTAPAWKRAACWGWTEQECRAAILKHLRRSTLHADMPDEDCMILSDDARLERIEYDSEPGPIEGPPPRKRHRSARHEADTDVPVDVEEEIELRTREIAAEREPQNQLAVAMVPRTPPRRPTTTIPTELLKNVSDALTRAHTAARHAQRLSTAAASAFSTEAEVIKEVHDTVEAVLRR